VIRIWLIRESRFMHRSKKPFAASVTRKHSAHSIRSMSTRSKSND
jgi:hypothetical protein